MKTERIQELRFLASTCPVVCQPPQCVVGNYALFLLECLDEIERLRDPDAMYQQVMKRAEELMGPVKSWPPGEYPFDKP